MVRAGVFIGVDQTGHLHKLNDAAAGAKRMHAWAIAQGMVDQTHAKLITDAGGKKVGPEEIYDAIKAIVDGPGVDQLIVYFAGHGVNINRGEQWLLTDAPERSSAAINLKGSVELAQYSGISHVVFFSDACRVAPEGIQAANVRGTEIFPNDSPADVSKPVDQFFACGLGRSAAELKDPASAAGNFCALYTDALLFALNGQAPEAFRPEPPINPEWRYVGADTLRDYLVKEVPRRVLAKGFADRVNQNPDAIVIASDNWVSRIPRADAPPARPIMAAPPGPTLLTVSRRVVNETIAGLSLHAGATPLRDEESELNRLEREFAEAARAIEPDFGPDHFETECGIKVRGAGVDEAFAIRVAKVECLGGERVRITQQNEPCVSVLLRFTNNTCAVVPAIHGYLAAVTFEEGELIDIAYEPAATSHRWGAYQEKMSELRRLRGIIAAATQNGHFRLENENAFPLARRMQYEKRIDPTLSIYAAYAYHDLQRRDIITQMCGFLRSDIGATLFDLELLARRLVDKAVGPNQRIVPFFPLLSQGWTLLSANRVRKHRVIETVEPFIKSSLWTLFGSEAFEKLKEPMAKGELL